MVLAKFRLSGDGMVLAVLPLRDVVADGVGHAIQWRDGSEERDLFELC